MTENSITLLIRGLEKRDQEAIADLWSRYKDKLTKLAKRELKNDPRVYDEEDLAASAFERLCRAADNGKYRISDREHLWALLLKITHDQAVDRAKYQKRIKRGEGEERGESVFGGVPGEDDQGGINNAAEDRLTPDSEAAMEESYQRLLDILPDKRMKEIVHMRLEGKKVASIAKDFGMTTRWAERKLQLIREIWQKELDDRKKNELGKQEDDREVENNNGDEPK